jgi:hypothetical protein
MFAAKRKLDLLYSRCETEPLRTNPWLPRKDESSRLV